MRKHLLFLGVLGLASAAHGQSSDGPADEAVQEEEAGDRAHEPDFVVPRPPHTITVVARGLEEDVRNTPQPMTVIGAGEIRSIQGPDVTRVLRRLPGVTLSRNGGQGAFTGMRVRGAASEQLLVLVDGVRVNDVSSPAGGYDFGNVLAGELDKIELLRGPGSLIWGADAIGGVLNLTTRAPDGLQASGEYGGYDQWSASAAYGVDGRSLDLGLSGGFARGEGFSAAAAGEEPDGFRQWHLGGRGGWQVAEGLEFVAHARHAEGEVEIDGFPAPAFSLADTAERQDTDETSAAAGLAFHGRRLTLRGNVSLSDTARALFDEAAGSEAYYRADGQTRRAELFGQYRLAGPLEKVALDFGADRSWSEFASDDGFAALAGKARQASGHALVTYDRGDLLLSGGGRYDRHSRFGGEWTFGAAGALVPAADWRLRVSYGEGFKAPSLFQLLSDFGNPALQPERSRGYDLGIEYGRTSSPVHLALSLFRRDSMGLIDFVSCFERTDGICAERPFGTYDNIGRARAEGFEVEAQSNLSRRLTVRAAWSFVRARDRTKGSANAGKDLARRPRHAVNLSADWATGGSLYAATLGADLRIASASYDDAANRVRLPRHALLDLRISKPVLLLDHDRQRTLDLHARVENVWDEDYQTAAGYAMPGRAAFVGLGTRF